MSNPRIVIIGNGISGITAARHIRKRSDAEITVIGKESEHFFSRTALMYVYMGHMRYQDIKPYEDHFWEKNRIGLKHGTVTRVDTERKIVELTDGGTLTYDSLIIATGSTTNFFGNKQVEDQAMQLKSISQALDIRSDFLQDFEAALYLSDEAHQRRHCLAKHDGLGRTGALGLGLGTKPVRREDRPVVAEPLLGDATHRHADLAVLTPGRAARLLGGEFGQRPEEGQLVGGHLLVSIEDALDLVDRAHGSAGAKLEEKGVPAVSYTHLTLPTSDLV